MLLLPEWLQDRNTALLLVVLLLVLWLWLLVRRREEEGQNIPTRPTPMSADELGRIVFMAARSQDLTRYRGLFLNGAEAKQILDSHAAAYLEQRSFEVLKESLATLAAQLPTGCTYDGLAEQRGRMMTIQVKTREGPQPIKVGTVARVGPVWRLLEPALQR